MFIKIDSQLILNRYLDKLADFGSNFLAALIIVLIGFKIVSIIVSLIRKAMERHDADFAAVTFTNSFVKIVLRCIVLFMAAEKLGVKGSSIVALIGSAGLAIGLALQGSLSNIAGGVLLLLLKPFQVGDYIVIDGTNCEGRVYAMDIFYTKLHTFDNKTVVIPNGTMANSNITNNTNQEHRLIDIRIGVSFESDIGHVKDVMYQVAQQENMTLNEEVVVFVSELADSSVVMGLRAWVPTDDYFPVKWSLTEHLKQAFDLEGIEIPYNKLDVSILKQPAV